MRKIFLNLILASALLFMISFVAADVQWVPSNSLYNLGDTVNMSSTVTGSSFSAYLVCNDNQVMQFPTYFSNLPLVNYSIPIQFTITPDILTTSSELCKIKVLLDGATFFSPSFQISNVVNVSVSSTGREFRPGNQIAISGTAIKVNGQNINGAANINLSFGNVSILQGSAPINNGNFYFNITLPPSSAAGQYLVNIIANELDSSGQQINSGYTSFNILVDQVPTTLNIVPLGEANIMPGQTYSIRTILYDQSGQEIVAPVSLSVKDGKGEVMDEETITTGQVIDIPISYNDAPGTWSIFATASDLNAQSNFGVSKNSAVSVDLVNNTIWITNKGNVPYNDSILVKVGSKTLSFNVSLDVGQTQKYVLSAPDGYYTVQILNPQGDSLYTGKASLTGNAIDIRQASQDVVSFIQYPVVWIFLIVILAVAIFFLFKRIRKNRFMKKIDLNRSFKLRDGIVISNNGEDVYDRNRMVRSRNIAEFSPSIQGDKQASSIVCLDIKNFEETRSGKGGINETMNRLKYLADESNAVVYENGSYFFFIFAPVKTGALNNELSAIESAQKMRRILEDHNRLMKQKIAFGIGVNYGNIIAKQGMTGMKFMSLGNLISIVKKLSSLANGEVVLSKEIRNRVATDVKTEMRREGDLEFYPLIEIRNREKSEKFIKEFMSKLEREEKERQI